MAGAENTPRGNRKAQAPEHAPGAEADLPFATEARNYLTENS
jgi:hypothetical protein